MPSHPMHLLGPLTPAERTTSPDTRGLTAEVAFPRGQARLCAKAPFFFSPSNRANRDCHFADAGQTLTVHTHGHGALHGPGEGAAAGVAFQWPPVVRTQSGNPATGSRRHSGETEGKMKDRKESSSRVIKREVKLQIARRQQ